MREIVCHEAARGVFEPLPTRAQKRQAKLKQEARAKKIDHALNVVGITFMGVCYVTVFVLFVFAETIWPVVRP